VDREDRRSLAADHRDEQRGMPVVRVDDVGRLIRERGRDRAAEERVALRVVGRAVHAIASDALVGDEHDTDTLALDLGICHAHVRRAVADGALDGVVGDAPLRAVDRPVERDVKRDPAAKPGEGLRERPGDVGEATDLGEGGGLGGGESDLERRHSEIVKSS
jgi:hypothetical protein